MSVITYKCPNCGGELIFAPAKQRYQCEYCNSDFSQEELEEMEPQKGAEQKIDDGESEESFGQQTSAAVGGDSGEPGSSNSQAENETIDRDTPRMEKAADGQAVVYTCPSCGAQIVTDETTAATFCYYCHNPVVLEGRLSGEYLPDNVIPFAIDRKAAVQQFMDFVSRKKFVPKAFFEESQIEKLSGVYYPYWICDFGVDAGLDGEASRTRVWRTGETEYTETSIYHVERRGRIELKNITKNALKKTDKALVESVGPFRLKDVKPFSMGYLSGFLAEKRDMEKQEFEPEVQTEAKEYSERILRDTVSGYGTVTVHNSSARLEREDWRYLLLPVWVLTYPGRNGQMYYYALNGQTGNVCGKLPLDHKKLGIFSGIVGLVVMILLLIGGYLL